MIYAVARSMKNTWNNVVEPMNRCLVHACMDGNLSLVETLIDHGADIHYENDAPILTACFWGHLDVVECLLGEGVDVNTNDGFMINYSSALGYLNMVDLLLNSGSKIYDALSNASDKGNSIAIDSMRNSTAAYEYESETKLYLETAKLLLKHGAVPDKESLRYAVKTGDLEMVKLLADNGAKYDIEDIRICVKMSKYLEVIIDYDPSQVNNLEPSSESGPDYALLVDVLMTYSNKEVVEHAIRTGNLLGVTDNRAKIRAKRLGDFDQILEYLTSME